MTDDHFDDEQLEDALRRELTSWRVPYDSTRADEMISAATSAQVRRLPRLAAPLATAAAVLTVGAGIAVFAALRPVDHAIPAGGTTSAPPVAPDHVVCAVVRPLPIGRIVVGPNISEPPARVQQRLVRQAERRAHLQLRVARREARQVRSGTLRPPEASVEPLPTRVTLHPVPVPHIATATCAVLPRAGCLHASAKHICTVVVRSASGTALPPVTPVRAAPSPRPTRR